MNVSRALPAILAFSAALTLGASSAAAQQPTDKPIVNTPEVFNLEKLAAQGKELLAKAKASGKDSVGITVSNYKGHYMTLNARVKSGGGEFHKNWNDFLIVLDGGGTELTGGTLVDGKAGSGPGEMRGTKLDGATSHTLHKGDFIHIPAGTNHQQLVGPGQTLTVLAIKVEAKDAAGSAALMDLFNMQNASKQTKQIASATK